MTPNALVDKIIGELNRQRNEAIYAALEHHGYSKEWFFDPNHMDRIEITCISHPGDINEALIYRVDGLSLFTVVSSVHYDSQESKVYISVNVTHFEK